MPNKNEKDATLSEQILLDGLTNPNPLIQQLSTAMMTNDPFKALASEVEPFLRRNLEQESITLSNFCFKVNLGEYDNDLVNIFLSYRQTLSLTEFETWTITEDDSYWFIATIEELFQEHHPEIPLNSYLSLPDKRISDNIPFSTILRIVEALKTELSR